MGWDGMERNGTGEDGTGWNGNLMGTGKERESKESTVSNIFLFY